MSGGTPSSTAGQVVEGREELERRARELMKVAWAKRGGSVESMVAAVGHLQSRGAVSRTAWYGWQDDPSTTSLLTGLAFMKMVGPERTMQIIFGEDVDLEHLMELAKTGGELDPDQEAIVVQELLRMDSDRQTENAEIRRRLTELERRLSGQGRPQ